MPSLAARDEATGCGRVAATHVQAQGEIDSVRVNDEVGDCKNENGESDHALVGDGQRDPASQQRAHCQRWEHGPTAALPHARATANGGASRSTAGRRAVNSACTSSSSAMYS